MALLDVRDVSVRFGGIVALDDLSFSIERGRDLRADRPERRRQDDAVQRRLADLRAARAAASTSTADDLLDVAGPRHRRARRRPHVPEPRAVPPPDRARERDGRRAQPHARSTSLTAPFRIGVRREERRLTQDAMDILGDLGLAQHALRPAAGLPYGTLKRIELARAMAAQPTLLLLDEPASGLTHAEVDELGDDDPRPPRPLPAHRAARRAPHAAGDGHLRQGRRARLRPQDRRGHAGRGAERPEGDRGLPREHAA